jgi:hypothetical protein
VILHKSQKNVRFCNLIFFASTAADAGNYLGRSYVWLASATADWVPANPIVDDAYHIDHIGEGSIGVADVMKRGWNLSQ